MQLGLRLEQLETLSEGNVFDSLRQSHRLVGPVLRPERAWSVDGSWHKPLARAHSRLDDVVAERPAPPAMRPGRSN